MAFTSQEETLLRIILNSYTAAGYTSAAQVTKALTRQRLEQDMAVIQSNRRNAQTAYGSTTEDYNVLLASYDQAEAAKQSEIDAL